MNPAQSNQNHWSQEDHDIDTEFSEVISVLDDQPQSVRVPSKLDRKIKTMARGSDLDNIEKHWIFSNAARLTLGILVFFAVALLWVSL